MQIEKTFVFGGGECIITGPSEVDASCMKYFDELEYDCWALIKKYADVFGFKFENIDGNMDDIDFFAAKEVQETIIKLFEDSGVKICVADEQVIVDRRVVFEEKYVDEEENITTYYFISPDGWLGGEKDYPNAEHWAISVEFPTNDAEVRRALVEISPVVDGEYIDWRDVDMPYEEIEALMDLAEKSLKLNIEDQISKASNRSEIVNCSSKGVEKSFETVEPEL